MNNVISALTARTQLGQILKRTSTNNERFLVERRGEPQAVIMSFKDYIDTIAPAPEWLKASWKNAEQRGTSKLSMRQIDTIIAEVRSAQEPKKKAKQPAR
jgi:prevent-host-death family protein